MQEPNKIGDTAVILSNTRRRLAAAALTVATLGGTVLAVAPTADAAVTPTSTASCLFDYTPTPNFAAVRAWKDTAGSTRRLYRIAFGAAAGSNTSEKIKAANGWQSHTRFGAAYKASQIQYFNPPITSHLGPVTTLAQAPYAIGVLWFNIELTNAAGHKCHQAWQVSATSTRSNPAGPSATLTQGPKAGGLNTSTG